jgi:hypothetical protein
MPIYKRISLVAVALATLSVAVSCTGFFVNQPNSVTVTTAANGGGSSTFTVAQGSTVKLFATASFNSGNKDETNSASWQSSTACATVNAGLVTGVGAATNVTITASVGGVTGSATGTVTGGQGLTISSSPSGPTFSNGTTAVFSAALNGSDVTSSTTWSSSNTSVATFSSNTASFVSAGTATITGSYVANGTCASGSTSITVQ